MEQALAMLVLLGFAVWGLALVRGREERALLHRERQTEARASIARAAYTPAYPMLHTLNLHTAEPKALPAPLPVVADRPALPGPLTLGQVQAGGWAPTVGAILLGVGPAGALLTVPIGDQLCHVVTAGKTGSGKSNTLRLLLTQLAAVGAEYYICDPHFTPVNPTTGEDWRALALASAPRRALTGKGEIVALVDGLAAEVDARLTRWHAGTAPGPARFYLFEELPSLADADKDFMRKLGRLLREGRKLGLYVITAAQDMLISTVGGSAGLRSQFATVYYGGGDPYTARALLAVKVAEPPGRGVCWLRSVADVEPRQVRVPLVTNADIAGLLGETARNGPETARNGETAHVIEGRFAPIADAAPPVSPVSPTPETGPETAKRAAVRAALLTEESYGAIICRIWQVKPGGSDGYIRACAEMRAIVADLARGGA